MSLYAPFVIKPSLAAFYLNINRLNTVKTASIYFIENFKSNKAVKIISTAAPTQATVKCNVISNFPPLSDFLIVQNRYRRRNKISMFLKRRQYYDGCLTNFAADDNSTKSHQITTEILHRAYSSTMDAALCTVLVVPCVIDRQ